MRAAVLYRLKSLRGSLPTPSSSSVSFSGIAAALLCLGRWRSPGRCAATIAPDPWLHPTTTPPNSARPEPFRRDHDRHRHHDRLGHFPCLPAFPRMIGSPGRLRPRGGYARGLTVLARSPTANSHRRMPQAGASPFSRDAYSPLWRFRFGWTLVAVIPQEWNHTARAVGFARFFSVSGAEHLGIQLHHRPDPTSSALRRSHSPTAQLSGSW